MNNPKLRIFKSNINAEFYYHLRASIGEIILNGEGHETTESCRNGIASVKVNEL